MNAKTRTKLQEVFNKARILERSLDKLESHINFYGHDVTAYEGEEIYKTIELYKTSGFSQALEYLKELMEE